MIYLFRELVKRHEMSAVVIYKRRWHTHHYALIPVKERDDTTNCIAFVYPRNRFRELMDTEDQRTAKMIPGWQAI